MANYANLLATIAANIYTNNNNEVTAAMVKTTVDQMVASLGAGYQFMDVATPTTTPGNSDVKQFYLASTPGVYTNFLDSASNPLSVGDAELAVFVYSTAWEAKKISLEGAVLSYMKPYEVDTIPGTNDYNINNPFMLANNIPLTHSGTIRKVKYRTNTGAKFFLIVASLNGTTITAKSVEEITPQGIGLNENAVNLQAGPGDFLFFSQNGDGVHQAPGYTVNAAFSAAVGGWLRCNNFLAPGQSDTVSLLANAAVPGLFELVDYKFELADGGAGQETIVLEVGAGKPYTKFYDAALFAAAQTAPVEIRIYEGDYDFYTEFGGSAFISSISGAATWDTILPLFTGSVKIRGIGNVNLSLEIPDSVYNDYTTACNKLSIINNRGNIDIENVNLSVKNCRYAIHDECDGQVAYAGGRHIFRNVRINAGTGATAGVGIGTSMSEYVFEDCHIVGNLSRNGIGLYVHTWPASGGFSLVIKNSAIVGYTRLQNYGTKVNQIAMSASYLSVVIGTEDAVTYTTNYMNIVAVGCNITSVNVLPAITSNPYPATFYNW